MNELQSIYNRILERMNKAMDFMDSPASIEEKVKWQPKVRELTTSLSALIEKSKQAGYEMTNTEILEGFK